MITIRARMSVMYRHRTPPRRRRLVDKTRPDMAIFFCYFPPDHRYRPIRNTNYFVTAITRRRTGRGTRQVVRRTFTRSRSTRPLPIRAKGRTKKIGPLEGQKTFFSPRSIHTGRSLNKPFAPLTSNSQNSCYPSIGHNIRYS